MTNATINLDDEIVASSIEPPLLPNSWKHLQLIDDKKKARDERCAGSRQRVAIELPVVERFPASRPRTAGDNVSEGQAIAIAMQSTRER